MKMIKGYESTYLLLSYFIILYIYMYI